jgi:hypothetical protein
VCIIDYLRKSFSALNIKTIIYIGALLIIFIPMLLTNTLNASNATLVFVLLTTVYIISTRKWFYIQIVSSVFLLLMSIYMLETIFYQYTLKDASFIIASTLFGYFAVIFMTTLKNHAELTIRSPWVATMIGSVGTILTESILVVILNVNNVYIVGADGIIVMWVLSLLYLWIGKKITVNEPTRYDKLDYNLLEGRLEDIGFSATKMKNSDLKITDKTDETKSYKLFFSEEKLIIRDTDKLINNFIIVRDKKMKPIYSWLLRESAKSFEVRGPKPIRSEQFIIVNVVEKTSGTKLVEVPIPRSTKNYTLAVISVSEKDLKKIDKLIEQATVMLNSDD